MITLTHGEMSAVISTMGAELQSLKRNGTEYLWQGDPAFWGGRSPLLFPNTGRVWQNHYRHGDKTYAIDIHGFARTMDFTPVDVQPAKVTLALRSTDDTLAVYPFPFMLFVTYELTDSALAVTWFVRNEGSETMPFQIGAHPAFYLPAFDPDDTVRGYFSFKKADNASASNQDPLTYLIPLEGGCVDPTQPQPLKLDDEQMMPITAKTFDIDTYVIDATELRSCTLLSPERVPWLTVDFHMPILALWAPTIKHPDCPFVCIEPWCGSCDTIGYDGQLADRRVMNSLEPGQHWANTYRIRLH